MLLRIAKLLTHAARIYLLETFFFVNSRSLRVSNTCILHIAQYQNLVGGHAIKQFPRTSPVLCTSLLPHLCAGERQRHTRRLCRAVGGKIFRTLGEVLSDGLLRNKKLSFYNTLRFHRRYSKE